MTEKQYRTLLATCVRCGGCKAECPTYSASSAEPESPRGRLRLLHALSEGEIDQGKGFDEKIFSCILCGECSRSCPLGIDIIEVFYHARKELRKEDKRMRTMRLLSRVALRNTDLTVKAARPFYHLMRKSLLKRKLIPEGLELKVNHFKNIGIIKPNEKVGRVAVFSGCSPKHLYPELTFSLVNVLHTLRYEVVFPHGDVCCGAPFRTLGMEKRAIQYAEKNYRIFRNLNVDAIISLCPTCVLTLKNHYPLTIGKELHHVYDISTFLRERIGEISKPLSLRVTYHDPCHLSRLLKVEREPRELLSLTGATIIEPDRQVCCGFGGTFSLSFRKLSQDILKESGTELTKKNADALVTACPNCIFQLSKSIRDTPIYHIIELIEESICEESLSL